MSRPADAPLRLRPRPASPAGADAAGPPGAWSGTLLLPLLPRLEAAGQPVAAALLAGVLWLLAVATGGFHFSPDSMSYASLARGFLSGHPFTGTILWQGARPGRLQAIWPPLYPALIAAVHLLGPSLPASECICSGLCHAAAAALGVLAVRRACGRCPWLALPVLGGFSTLLYVAGFGWTEPLCLALLGVHYWLAAASIREAAAGGRLPARLLFGQAVFAGLAFLARYAAAPFLGTALLLPAVLAATARGRDLPGRARQALRGTAAAVLGAAVPVVPWTAAALGLAGHLGDPYVPLATPLAVLWRAARRATHDAIAETLAPSAKGAAVMAAEMHLLHLSLMGAAAALLIVLALRRRAAAPAGGVRPPVLLVAMLAADACAYTAVLLWMRSRYFFDAIGPRLLAPAYYPALLGLVVLAACVPWRLVAEALVLPVGAVIVLHGWHAGHAGLKHPRIAASLAGPWCSPGARGDCSLFAWVQAQTTDADLIIGNAPFTINFQLGRTTEEVAPYPYNPKPVAADFRRWSTEWLALHPEGHVFVALDADTGPIADGSAPYGALMAQMWRGGPVDLGLGFTATPVASGGAWRVLEIGQARAG